MTTRWIADNPRSERLPFWTRANVGEVLPEPPSPLGWDLVWEDGVLAGELRRLGLTGPSVHIDIVDSLEQHAHSGKLRRFVPNDEL